MDELHVPAVSEMRDTRALYVIDSHLHKLVRVFSSSSGERAGRLESEHQFRAV